ncbi:MAG: class I SAM-dependent rRNA methyltransferase [Bacteroidota bacterium]
MTTYPKIVLKHGKEDALKRRHPWLFSGAIQHIDGCPEEGSIVEVFSASNEFLGMGHYNEGSIAVRVFSFEQVEPNKDFWKQKLQDALALRELLGLCAGPNTNVYRLVFGEGDELPGLIIDYYNGTAVIQCHSYGMYTLRNVIAESLHEIYGYKLQAVFMKTKETLPAKFHEMVHDEYIMSGNSEHVVSENGCKFFVDWENGQKTGFFIDQRENRKLLMLFCKDKKVLNTFCYTGGFSVYALKAGAQLVHSVDSSAKAIEFTDKNIELNHFSNHNHQSYRADVMEFLKSTTETYDVIILDPPAYAKHVKTRHTAMQGYRRLNETAIRKINKSGFLFTFSCSQVVDSSLFRSTVMAAAIQSGRKVKIIAQMSQPPDHPVSAFHPEGEYLKGLVLFVE